MPKPRAGESKEDYISRCIPIVQDEGTAKDSKQAAAICYSMWGRKNEGEKMSKVDKYLGEASMGKAYDTTKGHPHEGFPEVDIPQKIYNVVGQSLWGSYKDILKAWKYDDYWALQVKADKFDIRMGDFKRLVSIGLSGIRYEPPKSMLLYFKR
jgi:hypothetical protein